MVVEVIVMIDKSNMSKNDSVHYAKQLKQSGMNIVTNAKQKH